MSQQENYKIRIGITQGDINGVGLEVIVKSLQNSDILELFTPVVFASADLFEKTARSLDLDDFKYRIIAGGEEITDGEINLIDVPEGADSQTPGTSSRAGGAAAVAALEAASRAMEDGFFDLLVTAPIDKHTVQGEKFNFPGHTEYLEDKFAVEGGKALMILAYDRLRVSPVTTHLPLAEVAPHITRDNVRNAIKDFNRALRMDFGCERPKIAVLSLNPHCGDGGTLGKEEQEEIIPAIEECKKEGIIALGPIAADGFFGSGAYNCYDGVLAMYHDQGLAPFKALAGGAGVNYTAGLNIIRTSPAHGTAYDKAGRGTADETSMREAIYAAIDIARRRDSYLDASENPLEIRVPQQKTKKGKDRPGEPEQDSKPTAEEANGENGQ